MNVERLRVILAEQIEGIHEVWIRGNCAVSEIPALVDAELRLLERLLKLGGVE